MAKQKYPIIPILSDRIEIARKANNLTQEKLAEKIGVTAQTIRKYESGRYGVPKPSVNCIANILGCSTDYLYGLTECFSQESREAEKADIQESIENAKEYQEIVEQQWKITADFFETFIGHKITHAYRYEKDGSFEPVIRIHDIVQINDSENREYYFDSKQETEDFLMNFYDDVKKILRYHLLDHEAEKKQLHGSRQPNCKSETSDNLFQQ